MTEHRGQTNEIIFISSQVKGRRLKLRPVALIMLCLANMYLKCLARRRKKKSRVKMCVLHARAFVSRQGIEPTPAHESGGHPALVLTAKGPIQTTLINVCMECTCLVRR